MRTRTGRRGTWGHWGLPAGARGTRSCAVHSFIHVTTSTNYYLLLLSLDRYALARLGACVHVVEPVRLSDARGCCGRTVEGTLSVTGR